MEMSNWLGLLGGLALFLYGMQMMSSGMEAAAGNKMKQILEKLTSNRILGVLVGAGITAIIQSSSATTVMVVGFVNSGMMTLQQAVWIIMGANIGTTITGQLVALDMGEIAPLIAIIGVAMIVFTKKEKLHHFGGILGGLGILFIGMDMMGSAMKPLAELPEFVGILTKFENPVFGILAGMIFTAIIQSSSASVGILQMLAKSGAIGMGSAVYVLFGQNIGTCITALLAAIGTNRNARRTTIIHITFNVIGTIVFTIICLSTPLVSLVESWTPGRVDAQIANMHTFFNVCTSLMLIPVGGYLAKFAEWILKDKEDEIEDGTMSLQYIHDIKYITEEQLGVSAMAMEGTKNEINRMIEMAKENVYASFAAIVRHSDRALEQVEEREEYIDFLNKEICRFISKVITHERTIEGSRIFNSYYRITSNVERIGDHALNIAEYSRRMQERGITFSAMAQEELKEMQTICNELLDLVLHKAEDLVTWHQRVACLEQRIDDMTVEFRENMFVRIKEGTCKEEGNILFSEMLTDFERIGDHALNISDEMMKIAMLHQ